MIDRQIWGVIAIHKVIVGPYKNLNISSPVMYTEQDMERMALESLLLSVQAWLKENQPIMKGDQVVIRVEAFLDRMIIPELCNPKLSYRVGEPSVLKALENSIGKKKGENFTMDVVFGAEAPIAKVRGNTVHFSATILDVLHTQKPDIDDDLARKLDPSCRSLSHLKEKLICKINNNAQEAMREQLVNDLIEAIIAGSKITLDQELLEHEYQVLVEQSQLMALKSGLPNINEAIQDFGGDVRFLADCRELAVKLASEKLIIDEIARLENITEPAVVLEKLLQWNKL